MLRTGFGLLSPTLFAPASFQAVQQVVAVAQQQCFATKQATPKAKKDVTPKSTAGAKASKPAKKTGADARPPSGYNLFVKERAATVLASSPAPSGTSTAAHAVKILAQNWKSMTDAEKAPYMNKAAALKSDTMQVGGRQGAPQKPYTIWSLHWAFGANLHSRWYLLVCTRSLARDLAPSIAMQHV